MTVEIMTEGEASTADDKIRDALGAAGFKQVAVSMTNGPLIFEL